MTEKAEKRHPEQKKPAPKPAADLTQSDLDKVTGGVGATVKKTPSPSGPIPIPYPNEVEP